jgi:hypothetical protein
MLRGVPSARCVVEIEIGWFGSVAEHAHAATVHATSNSLLVLITSPPVSCCRDDHAAGRRRPSKRLGFWSVKPQVVAQSIAATVVCFRALRTRPANVIICVTALLSLTRF